MCKIIAVKLHGQTAQCDKSNGFIISGPHMMVNLESKMRSEEPIILSDILHTLLGMIHLTFT